MRLESLDVVIVRVRHGSAGVAHDGGSGGGTGDRLHVALVPFLGVDVGGGIGGVLLRGDADRTAGFARGATDAAARLEGERGRGVERGSAVSESFQRERRARNAW